MARAEQALGNELGPAGQALAGRVLRREKQPKKEEEEREDAGMSVAGRLRQRQERAKRRRGVVGKAEEVVSKGFMQMTSALLRQSWIHLITTWGLTLIWINIHVFLRLVLGEKLFCKLGEEWVPRQAKAMTGEAGKLGGKAIGIVEVMGLILLDAIVIAALFMVFSAILIVLEWVFGIFGWFFDLMEGVGKTMEESNRIQGLPVPMPLPAHMPSGK